MNVCLQRHAARYIYVIPDGLKELMSDISREVLRSQPESIYTFVADYIDALIITRENARVAARLVQSLTEIAETTTDLLQRAGMKRDEADNVVCVIQRAFRKYLEEKKPMEQRPSDGSDEVEQTIMVSAVMAEAAIDPDKAELAAIIIQEAYKSFKIRKLREQELLKDAIDWRVAARSAIHLYRKTGVTHEEANRAATLIKAAYKGYYTRQLMRKIVDDERRLSEEIQAEDEVFVVESEKRLLEKSSKGEAEEKYVRIDYDSVKPHVDFGEAEVIASQEKATVKIDEGPVLYQPGGESTTSMIVKHGIDVLLTRAVDEIESRLAVDATPDPDVELTETLPVDETEMTAELEESEEPIATKIDDVSDAQTSTEYEEQTVKEEMSEEPSPEEQITTEEAEKEEIPPPEE